MFCLVTKIIYREILLYLLLPYTAIDMRGRFVNMNVQKYILDCCNNKESTNGRQGHSQIESDVIDNKTDCDNTVNQIKQSEDVQEGANLDMPFICTECDEGFSNKINLLKHKTKHSPMKSFNCPECSKNHRCARDLKRHIQSKHVNKQFSCSKCPLTFGSSERLNKHMHIHLGYTCPDCGHHSSNKHSFTNHVMNIHKPEERRFACTECDFKSTEAYRLIYHMKKHRGDKPFICDICGDRFVSLCNMQRHKLIHENKKPYECITCRKTFRTNSNLRKHMHSHTGEKAFFCDECEFGSMSRNDLRFHMRTVHSNERPFECVACGNKYKTKGNLTKHQNGSRGICRVTVPPFLDEQS